MRSIKFKAKKLNCGKWIKGSLAKTPFGTYIEWYEDSIYNKETVNPHTVCQYTGFLDKNGKEIYEGDVLRSDEYPFSFINEERKYLDLHLCLLVWDEDKCKFSMLCYTNKKHKLKIDKYFEEANYDIDQLWCSKFEVVGSIHDNEWQEKLGLYEIKQQTIMETNDNTITLSKSELRKIYNKSTKGNRNLLKKLCGEELFKFDYHDIKTFGDACRHLDISYNTLYRGDGADIEAHRQSNALYMLLIIQKAINNGVWCDKNGYSYYPYWVLYSKKEMERMSEEEKQEKGIKQLLSCAVAYNTENTGIHRAGTFHRGANTGASCEFPFCFNSEEAALYAAKQFESIFFDYYGIKVENNG